MENKYEYLKQKILHLKSNGVIRRDAEIVRDTGYSKGMVSSYINGKITPSKDFIEKFNQVYFPNESKTFQTFSEIKSEIKKIGGDATITPPANHSIIEITTASTSSAVLALLCEVIHNQTNEPLDAVKERATALLLTQQQKLEAFLKSML
jgi:transcriptional regulator with XRE-family HTH domain